MQPPRVIQGGMGFAVSGWKLASTVSRLGHLGVVSGSGLDLLVSRLLQSGDPGGHITRILERFPFPEIAQRVRAQHEIPGGKAPTAPFRRIPMWTATPSIALQQLAVVANFVEVALAKDGHDGIVGINYLTKIQLPLLASLYGAMLAGVDYVLMGAGLPREVPAILDRLAEGLDVEFPLSVEGAQPGDAYRTTFSPQRVLGAVPGPLRRPRFLAIVASNTLAALMAKNATGRVDGLVIEGHTAGGHNAPPRGKLVVDAHGEPEYGPRNDVDLAAIRQLGLPFWLAGSYASPERLHEAEQHGAAGIQAGTAFAFARESGLAPELKSAVLATLRQGPIRVFTDPNASPTGFPFKVVPLSGTLSEREVYDARVRNCDLGYLRRVYRKLDGRLGYRCPGEPVEDYVRKGGDEAETVGRKCLCNCLLANVGLAQRRDDGSLEMPMLTAGSELNAVTGFIPAGADSYGAGDVIRKLTAPARALAIIDVTSSAAAARDAARSAVPPGTARSGTS